MIERRRRRVLAATRGSARSPVRSSPFVQAAGRFLGPWKPGALNVVGIGDDRFHLRIPSHRMSVSATRCSSATARPHERSSRKALTTAEVLGGPRWLGTVVYFKRNRLSARMATKHDGLDVGVSGGKYALVALAVSSCVAGELK